MKSFKEFSKSFEKKYVCVRFDEHTNNNLRAFALENGFDTPSDFDFHTTIFYTDNEILMEDQEIDIREENNIIGMELFGMENDIPVLTLGNGFSSIREKFEKAGFRESRDYRPHISLTYNWSGKPDVNKVDVPKFKIIATKLIVESQDN